MGEHSRQKERITGSPGGAPRYRLLWFLAPRSVPPRRRRIRLSVSVSLRFSRCTSPFRGCDSRRLPARKASPRVLADRTHQSPKWAQQPHRVSEGNRIRIPPKHSHIPNDPPLLRRNGRGFRRRRGRRGCLRLRGSATRRGQWFSGRGTRG